MHFLAFAFFSLVLTAADETSCQHDSSTFRCVKFLRNYDGDTITVDIPNVHPLIGKNISVRIFGVDTPEIKGKDSCEKTAARNARNLVNSLLRNAKQINLSNIQRDKYFRILAEVTVDGKGLREVLVKNNLAVAYDGGKKSSVNWCSSNKGFR